jgi:hypothetical protein
MARRSPTRAAKSGLAALAGGIVLLITAALVQPALGAVAAHPYDDNLTCAYFGWSSSFKIDRQPTDGDYTATPPVETHGTIPAGMIVTISNVVVDTTAKTVTFDWSTTKSATEVRINAVLVKFGNGGLRYDYGQAGATGDVGLQSTKDSISHVDFCFGVYEPTTTTTEAATTTTGGQRLTTTTQVVTTTTEAVTTTTEAAATTTEEPTTTTTAVNPTSEERTPTTGAVAGVQIQRELPRTGLATLPLSLMGFGLVGIGLLLMAYDRRQALSSS